MLPLEHYFVDCGGTTGEVIVNGEGAFRTFDLELDDFAAETVGSISI